MEPDQEAEISPADLYRDCASNSYLIGRKKFTDEDSARRFEHAN